MKNKKPKFLLTITMPIMTCLVYGILASLIFNAPIENPANNDLMAEKMAVMILWLSVGIGFLVLLPFNDLLSGVGPVFLTIIMAFIQFSVIGFIADYFFNRAAMRSEQAQLQTDEFVEEMNTILK